MPPSPKHLGIIKSPTHVDKLLSLSVSVSQSIEDELIISESFRPLCARALKFMSESNAVLGPSVHSVEAQSQISSPELEEGEDGTSR